MKSPFINLKTTSSLNQKQTAAVMFVQSCEGKLSKEEKDIIMHMTETDLYKYVKRCKFMYGLDMESSFNEDSRYMCNHLLSVLQTAKS